MENYVLLVDTESAERQINEQALRANNIAGMIIRLNHIEGGHHLDENFSAQWAEAENANLLRIPFFIYDPWADGQENYDWLVRYIPFETNALMVNIEVSKPGYSPDAYAAEVAKFCQLIAPRWKFMIYTGEGYLHLLSSWPADVDYWWAQYPFSLYPQAPEARTWAQVRAEIDSLSGPFNRDKIPGRYRMWQITEDRLILPGSPNPLDVDVFPGTITELQAWVHEKPSDVEPFPEVHTQPFPGVDYYQVYRFHSHCYIAVIDPAGKRFLVTPFALKRVSTVARELGAQIVINGGHYTASHAIGLHASEGRVFQPVIPYQPWINLSADHKPYINAFNSRQREYNALAGKRFIVENGRISPRTSSAWREVHPRTLVGVTLDGKLIECVVDGRQGPNNIGVDLFNGARIMIEFGAWEAIDLDGGGSSAMWVDDQIVNSPIENGVPGQERAVGTHIAMFVEGVVPPASSFIVVNPVRPRPNPSLYSISTRPNLPVGFTFESTASRVVTETIPPIIGTDYTIPWVQMLDGYWVPLFYKEEYVKKIER